ncbi:hypothetical protein VIGAN_06077100 [Vigna angularis var. angularis]|uniref:MYND-type domain-containing protein n=1 Tax=Vigna angularis var. angularis TaxID=157739 RepID=A0A0S3SA28_PHAAN|nr:uncharacterized protein LOC108338986 isoform X1 [Vigna angularis]BAT89734.1 hypothetical protein VIGAN_06077100 [Vigna angularis var. angularis]
MPASGASLDRNWLLGLLGLGEKGASISDHNIKTWLQILFLTLVIGFCCLLYQLAEDRESNHSVNEVDELDEFDNFYESWEREQEHPNGQLDRYFDEEDSHRTTVSGGGDGRRDGGCAFCGNFTTTRCSRCKSARYCSMKCQIIHWRSIHKYECYESKIAADKAKTTDNERTSEVVENSEMESASNASTVEDRVLWSPESDMAVKVSSGNHVNNLNGCKLCAKPSTTRCSRCKAVQYCSVKCLIMDWKRHKVDCNARVDSAPTERPHEHVGMLQNSYEEEDNIQSFGTLSLECHPAGSKSFKSPTEVSEDPTNRVLLYLEDEVAKSRNETLLLQSEVDEWKSLANSEREKFQSLKKQSNYQMLVLKKEKESISDAEKKAYQVIHSLYKRLNHLQNAVQESNAEKRKLEEHVQCLESECADLKKVLQEEHRRAQRLTVESGKNHEAAKIAMKEVEAVRQEIQEEREHSQHLKENFRRDLVFAESRAAIAEEKLSDLYRKIRTSDYKICSVCLFNDKDLAFGCGHMTCRDCGSKLSRCPICREQITNYIKLFPG